MVSILSLFGERWVFPRGTRDLQRRPLEVLDRPGAHQNYPKTLPPVGSLTGGNDFEFLWEHFGTIWASKTLASLVAPFWPDFRPILGQILEPIRPDLSPLWGALGLSTRPPRPPAKAVGGPRPPADDVEPLPIPFLCLNFLLLLSPGHVQISIPTAMCLSSPFVLLLEATMAYVCRAVTPSVYILNFGGTCRTGLRRAL